MYNSVKPNLTTTFIALPPRTVSLPHLHSQGFWIRLFTKLLKLEESLSFAKNKSFVFSDLLHFGEPLWLIVGFSWCSHESHESNMWSMMALLLIYALVIISYIKTVGYQKDELMTLNHPHNRPLFIQAFLYLSIDLLKHSIFLNKVNYRIPFI